MKLHDLKYFIFVFGALCTGKPQNNLINSGGECKVIEKATGDIKPCQFPFIYNNKTYHGCTTVDNEENGDNGIAWCSTKTDQLDEHEDSNGFYGECPSQTESKCLTEEQGLTSEEYEIKNTVQSLKPVDIKETESSCNCQGYATCEWSTQLVNQLSFLPQNHPLWKHNSIFFSQRICDRPNQYVWCCRDGDFPRESELNILNKKDVDLTSDSGKWQPSGDKGECGFRLTIDNIVGGSKTKLGAFPHMALLGYDLEDDGIIDGYVCGGSLINKWYVLTAAHCINTENGVPKEIVLGDWKLSTDPDTTGVNIPSKITRKPVNFLIHESYPATKELNANGENQRNDIALIRLDKAVPIFSEEPSKSFAQPICLPWSEYVDVNHPAIKITDFKDDRGKKHNEVIVTGWGKKRKCVLCEKRDSTTKAFSDVLMRVKLPITNSIPGCRAFKTDSTQICAGGIEGPIKRGKPIYKGKDSCNADSGGPMVVRETSDDKWYQAGIVSFGPNPCGKLGAPGVYTKVSAFLPWIKSKLDE